MSIGLTHMQRRCLLLIHDAVQREGIAPSMEELVHALGLKSRSGPHRLIKALEERGYLRRMPNRSRALEVLQLPQQARAPAQPLSCEVMLADAAFPSDAHRALDKLLAQVP